MPYSVSPRRKEATAGRKPTMNWGTRMPKRVAHMKCPNSWKPIENSRPTANATIPRTDSSNPFSSASGDGGAGVLPGPPLGGQHVLDAGGCAEVRRGVEGTRDDLDDGWERQVSGGERGDRLLVRGVVQRRDDAAGLPRLPGEPDGGEHLGVQRQEFPGARGRPVQG